MIIFIVSNGIIVTTVDTVTPIVVTILVVIIQGIVVAVTVPKVETHGHFLVGSNSEELLSYYRMHIWLVVVICTLMLSMIIFLISNGIIVTMVVTVTPILSMIIFTPMLSVR